MANHTEANDIVPKHELRIEFVQYTRTASPDGFNGNVDSEASFLALYESGEISKAVQVSKISGVDGKVHCLLVDNLDEIWDMQPFSKSEVWGVLTTGVPIAKEQ